MFESTFTLWAIAALGFTARVNGLLLGYVGVLTVLVQVVLAGALSLAMAPYELRVLCIRPGRRACDEESAAVGTPGAAPADPAHDGADGQDDEDGDGAERQERPPVPVSGGAAVGAEPDHR